MASFVSYSNFPSIHIPSGSIAGPYHQRSGSMNPVMGSNMNGYPLPGSNHPAFTPQPHQLDSMYQPGHHQSTSFYLPPPGFSYMQPPPPMAAPQLPVPAPLMGHGQIQPGMPSQAMIMNQQPVAMQPPANHVSEDTEQVVNGGVCEILDYEINIMSEFVTKNACLSFGSFDVPHDVMDLFTNSISSVLGSTRLPSATIFLSLDYLIKYLDLIGCNFQSIGGNSIDIIYQNLVVAFVLANKFNDDKTFTNKSWAQATGMDLMTINQYEKNWLKMFGWRLFEDKFEAYDSFSESYNAFVREHTLSLYHQQQQQQQQQQHLPQSPVPTHRRQYSSASSMAYGYQTPNCGHSSMNYSSPVYSDLRNDSYNSVYEKQFEYSLSTQFSPLPKNFDNPNYNEHHQQSFWNEHHQQQLNRNYYCFSAY